MSAPSLFEGAADILADSRQAEVDECRLRGTIHDSRDCALASELYDLIKEHGAGRVLDTLAKAGAIASEHAVENSEEVGDDDRRALTSAAAYLKNAAAMLAE